MSVIESTLPGITALVNTSQVSRPFKRQPTSTLFAIGYANWGPGRVPTVITSWQQFKDIYGGFCQHSYLAELAYVFFNLYGGKQMVVARVVGDEGLNDSQIYSSVNVNNRVTPTPATAYQFIAKHVSDIVDISVTVSSNSTSGDANKVDLTVVSNFLKITESYPDVDLRIAATRNAIRDKSKLLSGFGIIAGAISGTTGRPAAGVYQLTGGTDGHASIDNAFVGDFLKSFEDENVGTGQVVCPGIEAEELQAEMIAHAEKYQRLAIIDTSIGLNMEQVYEVSSSAISSHASMYYPWVEMLALDGSGVKKFYPPSIFAAGECAKVDRLYGTHKAPANNGTVPLALDVERAENGMSVINDGVREYLNGKNINVIAPIAGQGIKIYGARVLAPSGDTRVQFVHERRMLNLIYYTAKLGYAWAPFAVVDGTGRLFRDLKSSAETFLRQLWRAGGLFGKTEEDAFIVVCDETNNPPEDLEQGIVNVQIGVKLSPTAEKIFVKIDNVPLSSDLNVLQQN